MGEHLVLLVDRLITESTLEASIESRKLAKCGSLMESSVDPESESDARTSSGSQVAAGESAECRICQDEDEDSNMETPCSCCGSLKYAHRACVQRWCNEKGDTTCEICLQQFKPDYTSPPKLFRYGRIPMSFRGNWEISHDVRNRQFITMVPTNRDFDDYASSSSRSVAYCRLVAVIFTVLLILRNCLPFVIGSTERYSMALFIMLLLRTAGIVVPLYVLLRAVTAFPSPRRRFQQDNHEVPIPTSEGEVAEAHP